jgi:hypothetical protein
MNGLEEDEIQLTWQKLKLMMMKMGNFTKMGDPIALYDWSEIGLERVIYNKINYGWIFKIISKEKFVHAVIKYDLL